MELTVAYNVDSTPIVIQLYREGESTFRLYAIVDVEEQYNTLLECGTEEAVECFRNLQIKYYGKVINKDNDI